MSLFEYFGFEHETVWLKATAVLFIRSVLVKIHLPLYNQVLSILCNKFVFVFKAILPFLLMTMKLVCVILKHGEPSLIAVDPWAAKYAALPSASRAPRRAQRRNQGGYFVAAQRTNDSCSNSTHL
jgi:hypothetical protein